jgi:hypothetical protein
MFVGYSAVGLFGHQANDICLQLLKVFVVWIIAVLPA